MIFSKYQSLNNSVLSCLVSGLFTSEIGHIYPWLRLPFFRVGHTQIWSPMLRNRLILFKSNFVVPHSMIVQRFQSRMVACKVYHQKMIEKEIVVKNFENSDWYLGPFYQVKRNRIKPDKSGHLNLGLSG